jgi:hypothetical protein
VLAPVLREDRPAGPSAAPDRCPPAVVPARPSNPAVNGVPMGLSGRRAAVPNVVPSGAGQRVASSASADRAVLRIAAPVASVALKTGAPTAGALKSAARSVVSKGVVLMVPALRAARERAAFQTVAVRRDAGLTAAGRSPVAAPMVARHFGPVAPWVVRRCGRLWWRPRPRLRPSASMPARPTT